MMLGDWTGGGEDILILFLIKIGGEFSGMQNLDWPAGSWHGF